MASTENFQVVGAKHETIVNIFLKNKIRLLSRLLTVDFILSSLFTLFYFYFSFPF